MYMAIVPFWDVHFIMPEKKISLEDTWVISESDLTTFVSMLMRNGAMTIKLVKREL